MSQPLSIARVSLLTKQVNSVTIETKYTIPMGVTANHDQAFNLIMLAQQYGSSRVLLNGTEYTIVGAARAIRDYFPKEGNHV